MKGELSTMYHSQIFPFQGVVINKDFLNFDRFSD